MWSLSFLHLALVLQINAAATPLRPRANGPDPCQAVSVSLNGQTFINKGLVGFGLIPSDFKDSTGDTMGGFGSAIAIKPGTWTEGKKGTFKGTLITQPDRGYNVINTVDYQARHHEIDFVLSSYYSATPLSFTDAQQTLKLHYKKTTLLVERHNTKTSGLDALGVRPPQHGYPFDPLADPQMPIASEDYDHLCMDNEGLVVNDDGTTWISDEYGPYIYRFRGKHLLQTIQPPNALLPRDATGALNFTSVTNEATGRTGNQGFEGLTLDKSTNTLYALLQTATVQDGGLDKSTSRYTRLLAWDVSHPDFRRPTLKGEWVVPLPQNSKKNTLGASELHFIKKGVFLALSRDGNGRGGSPTLSSYKQADLVDISHATDIHGTKFDDPANPIAVAGTLDASITPANYVSFVNYLNTTQLARFGLHNGDPNDPTLICAKWESLALAHCGDHKNPDDYFLFTVADNDFLTTNGVSLGVPYNGGIDNDNQFMVFRVTLPGAEKRSQITL